MIRLNQFIFVLPEPPSRDVSLFGQVPFLRSGLQFTEAPSEVAAKTDRRPPLEAARHESPVSRAVHSPFGISETASSGANACPRASLRLTCVARTVGS
jgi:hypothetical protein